MNSTLSSSNKEDKVETVDMASSVPEDLQASDITLFTKSTVCGVTWLVDYLD